jgi:hypothetical protein
VDAGDNNVTQCRDETKASTPTVEVPFGDAEAQFQEGTSGGTFLRKKWQYSSENDRDKPSGCDRKLINALRASVNQIQQQMSFLVQTKAATLPQRARVKNEYVKDDPGLRTTTQDQHVDLVSSIDSCDSEACDGAEARQKPSLSEQEPPPKKMKFTYTAGIADTHVASKPQARRKSVSKSAKVASYTKRQQMRDCSYRN